MERAWTLKFQQETWQTRVCSGCLGQGPRAAVRLHAVWRGLSAGGIGHCRPVSVRFLAEAGVSARCLALLSPSLPLHISRAPRVLFQGLVCVSDCSVRGKRDCRNKKRNVL